MRLRLLSLSSKGLAILASTALFSRSILIPPEEPMLSGMIIWVPGLFTSKARAKARRMLVASPVPGMIKAPERA